MAKMNRQIPQHHSRWIRLAVDLLIAVAEVASVVEFGFFSCTVDGLQRRLSWSLFRMFRHLLLSNCCCH